MRNDAQECRLQLSKFARFLPLLGDISSAIIQILDFPRGCSHPVAPLWDVQLQRLGDRGLHPVDNPRLDHCRHSLPSQIEDHRRIGRSIFILQSFTSSIRGSGSVLASRPVSEWPPSAVTTIIVSSSWWSAPTEGCPPPLSGCESLSSPPTRQAAFQLFDMPWLDCIATRTRFRRMRKRTLPECAPSVQTCPA